MDERKIDFTLISSERAPRNVGKTAREKAKKSTSGKPGGRRRQVGKQVNFEPDSAFRKEKDQAKAKPKGEKKAKNRRRKRRKSPPPPKPSARQRRRAPSD